MYLTEKNPRQPSLFDSTTMLWPPLQVWPECSLKLAKRRYIWFTGVCEHDQPCLDDGRFHAENIDKRTDHDWRIGPKLRMISGCCTRDFGFKLQTFYRKFAADGGWT